MVCEREKTDQEERVVVLHLQFSRLFELGHIALPLERAARGEEDVFVVLIHILDPIGKPGDSVIMNHLLPGSRHIGFRDKFVLANVNCDILRTDAFLRVQASGGWRMCE